MTPHDHQSDPLDAPHGLREDLRKLHSDRMFVPQEIDDAVLAAAREHLAPLRQRSRFGRWFAVGSGAGVAVAATVALIIWIGSGGFDQPRDEQTLADAAAVEDIDGNGRVNILDAFTLARRLEREGPLDASLDITGDGRVDEADVDAIASRAVALNGDRRS